MNAAFAMETGLLVIVAAKITLLGIVIVRATCWMPLAFVEVIALQMWTAMVFVTMWILVWETSTLAVYATAPVRFMGVVVRNWLPGLAIAMAMWMMRSVCAEAIVPPMTTTTEFATTWKDRVVAMSRPATTTPLRNLWTTNPSQNIAF